MMKLGFTLLGLACAVMAQAAELARFNFDEASGSYSEDAVSHLGALFSPGVQWAQGPFGTAFATGTNGASVALDAIPGADGIDAATLFLRFRRENAGVGKYPCLLTSDDWVNAGTIFFVHGESLAVRLRADNTEASWSAWTQMPTGRWASVALVFKRPDVTVYADGKLVAKGKWNHAFHLGHSHLGAWGADSFGGLIDDFRVWNEALPAERIAALASEGNYGGTGAATKRLGQGGAPIACFADKSTTLVLDSAGCISSLREQATGRELVMRPTPFLRVAFANGRNLPCRRLEKLSETRFRCSFPGQVGDAEFSVAPFAGGWMFTLDRWAVKDAATVEFAGVCPACDKWKGSFANAWSDEASAVAVRSCILAGEPSYRGDGLFVRVPARAAQGLRVALAAGPRAGFREQLKAMTIAAGVPRSDCGGAWAMESEQARKSYVFASVADGDIDYWIDLARRSGFSIIHINDYSWSGLLGPYPINPKAFPGGIDEMKRAADRVHAAGLQMGIHSLTGCINPRADWIHPVCDTNLVADYTYTLAAPLASNATELVVEELPGPKHSTVFTYSSNGNVLRIGGELLQYTGIRREKPYAFTGLTRGAFQTQRLEGTVPAGTRVDYLHQRYIAFYPKPDSSLADKLAARLAEVYNTCGLDDFYFDGSEGMGTRYGIDSMRHNIFKRFKANNGHSPSIEASCQGANNWWFQTRTATVDHGVWGVKRFHDWHIEWAVNQGRNANFLEPQMGWWAPRTAVPWARGHFPDEMEYFAGKNAGHDAAMSVQGVSGRPLPVGVKRQLAILGWYEKARLARAFTNEVVRYLAAPRTEARLRQNTNGVWQLTDVVCTTHRAGLPWMRDWTVPSACAPTGAALRVEALYAAGPEKDGKPFVAPDAFAKMKVDAASGVKTAFDPDVRDAQHGRTFRLAATNVAAPQKGSWARAKLAFDFPGLDLGAKRTAFGVWVKGDGSGALLNLQLTSPQEFLAGTAEHYVRLDFTGWRYVAVLLRERDAAQFADYAWPYGGYAAIYRTNVSTAHVASFAAYLNDVPKGRTATVELGEVKALEQVAAPPLKGASVVVNGETFALPFTLASGEYAELDGRAWTKYSEMGAAVERHTKGVTNAPTFRAGTNACSFKAPDGARAEVTAFVFGKTRDAFAPLTPQMKKALSTETMEPFEYVPAKGVLGPKYLPVRPGETVTLGIEIQGPVKDPSISFGAAVTCTFTETLAEGESLVCRDDRHWKVVETATGKELRTGVLSITLPEIHHTTPFSFKGEVPAGKSCVVEILKTYR